jgi:uncharacterized membrane protein
MTLTVIVIIVLVLLLFGGGGGYYAHRSYGPTGCGSVIGAVVILLLILWLLGVLHPR